ncbi:MAG: DrmE family protein, partial [Clostridium sp.]
MYNSSIWDSFKRFKLYQNNKEIKFTELEEQILNYISYEAKGNYLFIAPKDNDYFLLLSIIYNSLNMCYYNVFQGGNDILDTIKVGDVLQYYKSLCKLKDRNEKFLILEFKDGVHYLPVGLRYKLSKYNGEATVLNKMPTKQTNTRKKTKNLLAEIMDINIDEICKVSKKSILIVENKQRINNLIKTISIKVGDCDKVALSEVFPMAYFSSVDNIYHYKGNSNKEEPIVKFTSKIYIANELCKKIKNINSVLYLPKKINVDDLTDLKEIERKKNINKVSSVIVPIELERQIGNEYLHEDFSIKNTLINLDNIKESNAFNAKQYEYYKSYVNDSVEICTVIDKEISKLRKEINRYCGILSKIFISDDDIAKFVINSRKITKRIVSTPIPLKKFDDIIREKYPNETIESLKVELNKFSEEILRRNLTRDNKEIILKILSLIDRLNSLVITINPKWDKLNKIIMTSVNEPILIVNDNKFVRHAIRRYIKELFPYKNKNNIIVDTAATNVKGSNVFAKTIFTGLIEDNMFNNYKKYNTKQVLCIFYNFEKVYLDFLRRRYRAFLENLEVDEIVNNKEVLNSDADVYSEEDILKELELEVQLEELITIGYTPSLTGTSGISNPTIECSKILKFTDGRKAFIS